LLLYTRQNQGFGIGPFTNGAGLEEPSQIANTYDRDIGISCVGYCFGYQVKPLQYRRGAIKIRAGVSDIARENRRAGPALFKD
jgi:hypothetical protein